MTLLRRCVSKLLKIVEALNLTVGCPGSFARLAFPSVLLLFVSTISYAQQASPPSPPPADTKAAHDVLLLIEKLDAAFAVSAQKPEIESRLIDALAGLNDLDDSQNERLMPQFIANARAAIASYRESAQATSEREKLLADAKVKLQSAKALLRDYESTGSEKATNSSEPVPAGPRRPAVPTFPLPEPPIIPNSPETKSVSSAPASQAPATVNSSCTHPSWPSGQIWDIGSLVGLNSAYPSAAQLLGKPVKYYLLTSVPDEGDPPVGWWKKVDCEEEADILIFAKSHSENFGALRPNAQVYHILVTSAQNGAMLYNRMFLPEGSLWTPLEQTADRLRNSVAKQTEKQLTKERKQQSPK